MTSSSRRVRESNPVGRGRYTPGRVRQVGGGQARPLVPRMVKLPWIPAEQQWLDVLTVFRAEPIRNRVMLALAYDAALRREELCSLRTEDIDPAHRTLRIRAETTKTRRERVVPYSAATGVLLSGYLTHRATLSRARGPLFLSESRRNHAEPLTVWTWSKVVRRVALAAEVARFCTHTMRHLCLTDLARSGWERTRSPPSPVIPAPTPGCATSTCPAASCRTSSTAACADPLLARQHAHRTRRRHRRRWRRARHRRVTPSCGPFPLPGACRRGGRPGSIPAAMTGGWS